MICLSIRYVKKKSCSGHFSSTRPGGRSAIIFAAGPPRPRRISMAFMIDGTERELGAPRQRAGDEQHQHELFHIVFTSTLRSRNSVQA
jgi:hypothetical protein